MEGVRDEGMGGIQGCFGSVATAFTARHDTKAQEKQYLLLVHRA